MVRSCRIDPVAVVDIVAAGGVQFEMLRRVCGIYGVVVPYGRHDLKSVVALSAHSRRTADAGTRTTA